MVESVLIIEALKERNRIYVFGETLGLLKALWVAVILVDLSYYISWCSPQIIYFILPAC